MKNYHQKLPHRQLPGATYFITYRLFESIPIRIIQKFTEEYHSALKIIGENNPEENAARLSLQKKLLAKYDKYLDSNLNEPYWLKVPAIAEIVYNSLLHLNTTKINLDCFTIMSNHVHALFSLKNPDEDLFKIMQSHKSFTAKKSNALLNRRGKFWEIESYDHIVRGGEYEKIYNYIIQNPVKAGLVKEWRDWKWTFVS